ncbi:hypothetical protein J3Q64DRAFT_1869273 [Phycomyces blakesleeanus]
MDEIRFSVCPENKSSSGYNMSPLKSLSPINIKSFRESEIFHDVLIRVINDNSVQDVSVELYVNHDDQTASETSSITGTPLEQPEEESFFVHRLVLSAASDLIFEKLMEEKHEGFKREIVIRGVDPRIFERILDFVYGLSPGPNSVQEAIDLIPVTYQLKLDGIRQYLFQYLQLNISNQNMWGVWNCAEKFMCPDTQDICERKMKTKPLDTLQSVYWFSSDPKVVLNALKVDYLQKPVDEVVFYEAALIWRDAQIKKAKKWLYLDNKKVALSDVFAQIIACIRFPQMDASFLSEVVEKNEAVMNTTGVQELIFEAYRFQACGKKKITSVRCYPRKRF